MPYVVLVLRGTDVARWQLPADLHPDVSAVDDIARLQLAARRVGYSIRLCGAPAELRELIDLAGLSGIITESAGPDADGTGGALRI